MLIPLNMIIYLDCLIFKGGAYNSRASGRKGLSRDRVIIVMETFIHEVFFRAGVLSEGIHNWCQGGESLTCWGSLCPWRSGLRVHPWSQSWGLGVCWQRPGWCLEGLLVGGGGGGRSEVRDGQPALSWSHRAMPCLPRGTAGELV